MMHDMTLHRPFPCAFTPEGLNFNYVKFHDTTVQVRHNKQNILYSEFLYFANNEAATKNTPGYLQMYKTLGIKVMKSLPVIVNVDHRPQ